MKIISSNPFKTCPKCSLVFINLSVHLSKKHQIFSQSKIAMRARQMRVRRWLRSKLRNMEEI